MSKSEEIVVRHKEQLLEYFDNVAITVTTVEDGETITYADRGGNKYANLGSLRAHYKFLKAKIRDEEHLAVCAECRAKLAEMEEHDESDC